MISIMLKIVLLKKAKSYFVIFALLMFNVEFRREQQSTFSFAVCQETAKFQIRKRDKKA